MFSLNNRDHAFSLLGLKEFTDKEVQKSFARLQEPLKSAATATTEKTNPQDFQTLSIDVEIGIKRLAEKDYAIRLDNRTIAKVTKLVVGPPAAGLKTMTLAQYKRAVLILGEKLDPRVWNIGLSFLFTGKFLLTTAQPGLSPL